MLAVFGWRLDNIRMERDIRVEMPDTQELEYSEAAFVRANKFGTKIDNVFIRMGSDTLGVRHPQDVDVLLGEYILEQLDKRPQQSRVENNVEDVRIQRVYALREYVLGNKRLTDIRESKVGRAWMEEHHSKFAQIDPFMTSVAEEQLVPYLIERRKARHRSEIMHSELDLETGLRSLYDEGALGETQFVGMLALFEKLPDQPMSESAAESIALARKTATLNLSRTLKLKEDQIKKRYPNANPGFVLLHQMSGSPDNGLKPQTMDGLIELHLKAQGSEDREQMRRVLEGNMMFALRHLYEPEMDRLR